MSVAIPAAAISDANAGAAAAGAGAELVPMLLAIAGPESGWDPGALGDYKLAWGGPIVDRNTPGAFPTSFGYLQFYTDGGLGTGIDPAVLLDGPSNMRLGAEALLRALAGGKGLWDAFQPWSTRPKAFGLYEEITNDGYYPTGTAPAPTPAPAPAPPPPPPSADPGQPPGEDGGGSYTGPWPAEPPGPVAAAAAGAGSLWLFLVLALVASEV